ncbi:MAG: CarD family transcriptional regulator, partial [Candidatus Margulisiibacteriota bacterium]
MEIVKALRDSVYFREKVGELEKLKKVSFTGLVGSSATFLLTALKEKFNSLLVATSTSLETERIMAELEVLGIKGTYFPAPDVPPEEDKAAAKELIGQRLEVLSRWLKQEKMLVVAPLKAVLWKTIEPSQLGNLCLEVAKDQKVDLSKLIGKLVNLGYKRFEIVGEKGEFSVRGGIVDIFPVNCDLPVRIEFFEDIIESLRSFDPFSQRSVAKISKVEILPTYEKFETSVFAYLPQGALIILNEPLELSRTFDSLKEESIRYLDFAEVEKRSHIVFSSFLAPGEEEKFLSPPSFVGKIEDIPADAELVSRHAARLKEERPELKIILGRLRGGFVFEKHMVLSDRELFGEEEVVKKVKVAPREGISEELLVDLKVGDYVVHENYGIGIYRGMKT